MENKQVKAHFESMKELNSELMDLENLNELEIRYQAVMTMVQTLILDNKLIPLSNMIQQSFPEYGKHFE
jgi:hypothetical protein